VFCNDSLKQPPRHIRPAIPRLVLCAFFIPTLQGGGWQTFWNSASTLQFTVASCFPLHGTDSLFVRFEVLTEVVKKSSTIFWDITPTFRRNISPPLSGWSKSSKIPAWKLATWSVYSTPKMEAIYSSETSVDFQRITRHYIQEDSTLQTAYLFCVGLNLYSFLFRKPNSYCTSNLKYCN
jgi:hypothetical protein